MMNIRSRSVNVSRTELLEVLKSNLKIHKDQYLEAVEDFKSRLLSDFNDAYAKVLSKEAKDLKDFKFNFKFPEDHEKDFTDIIEMLEVSIDDTINLDQESFKAYFKNEWSWTSSFNNLSALYKAGSFLGG